MKFNYMSDLHLEAGPMTLPGGDYLLLAGDIVTMTLFNKRHETYYENFRKFFVEECAKYKKVFYVYGNHEYYHGTYQYTRGNMEAMFEDLGVDNVTILENEYVEVDDVLVYGATLWTDFGGGNPVFINAARQIMNDYHTIHYSGRFSDEAIKDVQEEDQWYFAETRKLKPEDTLRMHRNSLSKMREFYDDHPNQKIVVMTHHAPSFQSIAERFKDDLLGNPAYATELSEFVYVRPNIVAWVHGHIHAPNDYMMHGCHVVSNPRGYINHEEPMIDFNKVLEV